MLGASKDPDIDVLGRNMAVNHASNDDLERISIYSLKSPRRADRRNGNAVSDLGHDFSCRPEGRR